MAAVYFFYIIMYPWNNRVLNIHAITVYLRGNGLIDWTVGERQAKGWPP